MPLPGQRRSGGEYVVGHEHRRLPGLSVPGRGPGLSFELAYNSLDAGDVGIGEKWRHTYAMDLVTNGDGSKTVTQETGATVIFYPDESGGWSVPNRHVASLTDNGDGTWTFERRHFEFFTFNSSGQLTKIADRNGHEATLAYAGGDITVTDAAGRILVLDFENGRIVTVTDDRPSVEGGDRSLSFTYDGNGDLVTFNDIAGNDWHMVYDANHNQTKLYRPEGAAEFLGGNNSTTKFVENHYDAQGRVDWEKDELGRQIIFSYDTPTTGETTAIYPDGDKRVDTYVDGRRISVKWINAAGTEAHAVAYTYDPSTYRVVSMVDANLQTWDYEYASTGARDYVKDPLGRETTWTYNSFDQPLTMTDNDGVVTEWEYDAYGNLKKMTVAKGTADESVTSYVVDGAVATRGDVDSMTDGRGKVWNYTYEPDTGYLATSEDPRGNVTDYDYFHVGWPKTITAPKGVATGPSGDFESSFEYNNYGQVTLSTNADGEQAETTYDANGNVKTVKQNVHTPTTTDDETTTYTYDAADQLIETRRPDLVEVESDYWPGGELKFWEDGNQQRWHSTYDYAGRVKTQTDPNGKVTSYFYDANGNVDKVQQPGGNCAAPIGCVDYSYNDANELTAVDYSDGATPDITEITYDGVGRRQSQTVDGGAFVETWGYDALGRVTSHQDLSGKTSSYTWDDTSNLLTMTYPDGVGSVTYGYDDAGRMTSVDDWANPPVVITPDAHGNTEKITYPSATPGVDTFGYDDVDRMISAQWAKNTTVLGSADYDPRDEEGLVDVADYTGLPGPDEDFDYDQLDRLVGNGTHTVVYDPAGNVTLRGDGTHQRYDAASQLCWTSPTTPTGACNTPPSDATSYGFDDRGNRTGSSGPAGTEAFTYDQANRLTQAQVGDATGDQYQAMTPFTVLDTRSGSQVGKCPSQTSQCTTLNSTNGKTRTVRIAGQGGLPVAGEIEAVMLNVTVINTTVTTGNGALYVYPADIAQPATPTLNFKASDIVSNSVIARVDANGRIKVSAPDIPYFSSGVGTDVLIAVQGYFAPADPDEPGSQFEALNPARVMDTVFGGTGDCTPGGCTKLGANGTPNYRDVKVLGKGGIPDSPEVSSVAITVTALNTEGAGFLLLNPTGGTATGNLIYADQDLVSNLAIVPVGTDGRITITVLGRASRCGHRGIRLLHR